MWQTLGRLALSGATKALNAGSKLSPSGVVNSGGSAFQTLKDNMPVLEDEVTVEVVGQPGSNKQQLYFLALAAANGLVRRFGPLVSITAPFGMLMIEYDAAAEWVRCTIRYKWSMLQANVDSLQPHPGTIYDNLVLYRGPACDLVGGKFDFLDTDSIPGLRAGIPNPEQAPKLPFANQMILTSCPTTVEPKPKPVTQNPAPGPLLEGGPSILSPNPKPPGDNRSRGNVFISQEEKSAADGGAVITPGSYVNSAASSDPKKCCEKLAALVPMVFAALSAPATNSVMTYPTPVPGPKGG